jgi:hypothetical protein
MLEVFAAGPQSTDHFRFTALDACLDAADWQRSSSTRSRPLAPRGAQRIARDDHRWSLASGMDALRFCRASTTEHMYSTQMDAVEKLGQEIGELSAHLDSAVQRLLTCIRQFDEAAGWYREGAVSCAHWLTWRVGLDLVTAREKVRVARALGALPTLDQALASGVLSYAKVRALTRIATADNETRLLDLARHATGAQLDRIVRGYRRAQTTVDDYVAPVQDRGFDKREVPGGLVKLELVVSADEAAMIMSAVEKAREALREVRRQEPAAAAPSAAIARSPATVIPHASGAPAEARGAGSEAGFAAAPREGAAWRAAGSDNGAGPSETGRAATDGVATVPGVQAGEVLRASAGASPPLAQSPPVSIIDAFMFLAEAFLSHDLASAARPTDAARPPRHDNRYQVFVHLDQSVLAADDQWSATLEDGTQLKAETLRRLTCDAALIPTVTDATGAVLDVGRRTRSIPPALRRALWLRDRGCRFPGCTHTRFLHGHHIHHWLHGGRTSLANTILLCSRHHRMLHEEGFHTERATDGTLTFRAASGKPIPPVPPPAVVDDAIASLHEWAIDRGLTIDAETNLPWWDGSSPDYDWIVGTMMHGGLDVPIRDLHVPNVP